MAKHNVYVNLPLRELGKVDAIFDIYSDNKKTGTITISKGAFEWYPANAQKPIKLGWARFDRLMNSIKK